PRDIYSDRPAARGYEFANTEDGGRLLAEVDKHLDRDWRAAPVINGAHTQGDSKPAHSPSDRGHVIGAVTMAAPDDLKRAIDTTHKAFPAWRATPAEDRAACLERMADLMELHMAELMAICVREGGKC